MLFLKLLDLRETGADELERQPALEGERFPGVGADAQDRAVTGVQAPVEETRFVSEGPALVDARQDLRLVVADTGQGLAHLLVVRRGAEDGGGGLADFVVADDVVERVVPERADLQDLGSV